MNLVSCEKRSLPGIFPEFIGVNDMNKGIPKLMDKPHMNKGLPV